MIRCSDLLKSSLVPSFFFVCWHPVLKICILLGGVHHWDENGLKNTSAEPEEIRRIHAEMIVFVKVWLEEWKGGEVYPQQYGQSV